MTTTEAPHIAIPGESLVSAKQSRPGQGTHIQNGEICASVAGKVVISKDAISVLNASSSAAVAEVKGTKTDSGATPSASSAGILPYVNATVLGRVTRTTTRQAHVSIVVLDGRPCADNEFPALIRAQDVRATEKDGVRIGESFRPGDVVRGVVVSLAFSFLFLITYFFCRACD